MASMLMLGDQKVCNLAAGVLTSLRVINLVVNRNLFFYEKFFWMWFFLPRRAISMSPLKELPLRCQKKYTPKKPIPVNDFLASMRSCMIPMLRVSMKSLIAHCLQQTTWYFFNSCCSLLTRENYGYILRFMHLFFTIEMETPSNSKVLRSVHFSVRSSTLF